MKTKKKKEEEKEEETQKKKTKDEEEEEKEKKKKTSCWDQMARGAVLYLIVLVDVVFGLLQFVNQVGNVPGHVAAKLDWVLLHELPHPTNGSLMQEDISNIRWLPLCVLPCPWSEPLLGQSCQILWTDVASGWVIEARPPISKNSVWIWLATCTKHLLQNLWQLTHHLTPLGVEGILPGKVEGVWEQSREG